MSSGVSLGALGACALRVDQKGRQTLRRRGRTNYGENLFFFKQNCLGWQEANLSGKRGRAAKPGQQNEANLSGEKGDGVGRGKGQQNPPGCKTPGYATETSCTHLN